jgi:hypothetical protein
METDLPESIVVIMASMHAIMAISGKNIAPLPNLQNCRCTRKIAQAPTYR